MKSSVPRRRDGAEPAPVAEVSSASDQPQLPTGTVGPEERRARIALLAYLRAEERGFAPGCELADWLEAERQVDGALHAGTDGSS